MVGAYVEDPTVALHVPAVCDLEVIGALRALVRAKALGPERATESLAFYLALPLAHHDHRPLAARVWALRENFTPYDAAYVALAEGLQARLLTLDGALARAASTLTGVDVVGV